MVYLCAKTRPEQRQKSQRAQKKEWKFTFTLRAQAFNDCALDTVYFKNFKVKAQFMPAFFFSKH